MSNHKINLNNLIPERKCAKCGKNFVISDVYVYRKGHKYYCSWTCYNHRDDKKEKEKKYDHK